MKKNKYWMGLFVVVSLAGYGLWQWNQKNESAKPKFKEVAVTKGHLNITILSTGVVQPENRLEIKAPIAGRTEKVLVSEGVKVKRGQILAWMSSTERAALLDAASSRGAEEIKNWEDLYKPTSIMAPISGLIIQRNVESGQTFTTQDAIFVMSDRLTVKAQVDETDLAQIKLKQKAVIVLDAYPNDTIQATVDQIAYDAKTVNNVTTYIVDVLPDEAPDFIRSGMTANVTFKLPSKEDIMLVPAEALKTLGGKTLVSVKKPDQDKPMDQEIKTGLNDGKRFEVLSGLSEGDVVLVPEFKLDKKTNSGSPFAPSGPRQKGH